jgi:hypothetical protein
MTTPTVDLTTLGWHFAPLDGKLHYSSRLVIKPGKTFRLPKRARLELCATGFHASVLPLDALRYGKGPLVSRVLLSGTIIDGGDKHVARERTHLWIADATTTLHEFSVFAAELALDRREAKGHKIDPRSRAAIEAKRAWLRGDINNRQLAAAEAAARAAAEASTWAAARAAALAATWAATEAAAWAAAWSARAAAWAACWDELNADLTRRLEALAAGMA